MGKIPNDIKEMTFLYPTDTTFGLGCDAFNENLIQKISDIKNRPLDKNFIILVENASQLMDLVQVPDMAWELMDVSDKPLTLVYDRPTKKVPRYLLSNAGTIAIRLTEDRLSKGIIQKMKSPIVSTSANISTEKPPQQYSDIAPKILEEVDYIFPESETFVPRYPSSSIIQISEGGVVKVIRE